MISFVLVIVIHVSNYFCRAYGQIPDSEFIFSLLVDTVGRLSVPCFFMITGALLLGRNETVSKHMHRILRFVTALVVWSAVYYCWNRFYMKTPFDLGKIYYVPAEAHLWYLYAMIPIYFALPFLQVMCRSMSVNLEKVFLVIITAAVLLNYVFRALGGRAYYAMPLIGDQVYAYYVFLGYYIFKYHRNIRLSQKTLIMISAASLAATFLLTLWLSENSGSYYDRTLAYSCPFVILASLCFFAFMVRLGNSRIELKERTRRVIDLFCGCSFGIYLIHILFLDNYKKYMEPYDLTAWIAVPGLVVTIAAVSFACVWLIRKIPLGKKIT